MARPRTGNRIYWRYIDKDGNRQEKKRRPAKSQWSSPPRAYGDFREFRDVGGGREALTPPGATQATTDAEIAEKLASDRLEELRDRRRNRVLYGIEKPSTLKAYAAHHLEKKAEAGNTSEHWLEVSQRHLESAVEIFGADRDLNTIRPSNIETWIAHLREQPNGMGGTLSESTVRKYISSLSNMYRRAQTENAVPSGFNPVASLMEKPQDRQVEADWLEIHEAALLLEAARQHEQRGNAPDASDMIYPIVATFLLTGGRKSGVLGLEVSDVSFDKKTVTFRPNEHRGLKTENSRRAVTLWPQLEEILREYVFGGSGPRSGLLFPSVRTGRMITDLRDILDSVGGACGFEEGRIRTKMFRHTYCAARLQTCDGFRTDVELVEETDPETGETEEKRVERKTPIPVAKYTVAKELGHGGTNLVDRVYGHLGEVRHRSEVVEYRTEQHEDVLGERLKALTASA